MRRTLYALAAVFLFLLGPPIFAQSSAGPYTLSANAQCTNPIDTTGLATLGMQVTGTFSLTLQPEVSLGGQTPVDTQVTPSTSSTPQSTITTTGVYSASVAGAKNFLICVSSYSSGSATIYFQGSNLSAKGIGGTGGGSGGTPAPPNGGIQFDNSGAFGGSATTINAAGSITIPASQAILAGSGFQLGSTTGISFLFDANCADSSATGGFCLLDNASSGLFENGAGAVSLSADGATCAALSAEEVQVGCGGNTVDMTGATAVKAATPASNLNTTQIPTTAWTNTYFATKASPALTGTPTAPTATNLDHSTQIATDAFVQEGPRVVFSLNCTQSTCATSYATIFTTGSGASGPGQAGLYRFDFYGVTTGTSTNCNITVLLEYTDESGAQTNQQVLVWTANGSANNSFTDATLSGALPVWWSVPSTTIGYYLQIGGLSCTGLAYSAHLKLVQIG